MDINRILARIDELQKPLGLSDRALSLKASGSTDLIRNWRRSAAQGKPASANAQSFSAVAAALNVPLEELLGDVQSPEARQIAHLAEMLPAELRHELLGYATALAARIDPAMRASTSEDE